MEINKIYNMDCLEGLKQLDSNSVDFVITSPPYNQSKSMKHKTNIYSDYDELFEGLEDENEK